MAESVEALARRRERAAQHWRGKSAAAVSITVGMGTCGLAAGAGDALAAVRAELARRNLSAEIGQVGCVGMCSYEPMVELQAAGRPRVNYGHAKAEAIPEIFAAYFDAAPLRRAVIVGQAAAGPAEHEGRVLHSLHFVDPASGENIPFQRKQLRVVLGKCGLIDPESIDDYLALDGYLALGKVLSSMSPEDVLAEMKDSGLRGRGGAGFLTGLKWEFARRSREFPKYVICNADEGDPGAFMDRSILEGDPHSVLEGMTIAGYAIGAREGYIYCRAEYPLAIKRLRAAIAQARAYGLLGEDILGSGFSFDLYVKEGAGAFVCGEETALMASIEGKRGEPRPRPPFPAVAGLWHKPSNVNNVKSYATAPHIILHGAAWFKGIGPEKSPGTAIFALTGKIHNQGLIEVPMGIPLGEIIFDIGGGIPRGKRFKAVQTGGPLGGCLPASALNTPVDFDSLTAAGATMGSGGMIVVDEDTCMVEFARYFLQFATAESCGKCVPCRIGGQRLLEVLTRISEGQGTPADLEQIKSISANMREAALCSLGQLTPGPVMSGLRFFEQEFIEHVVEKKCEAGQCKALVRAKCINACPAGVDSPAYLALISQGRYAEGLEIHRQRNPFALVCGRVCPAFCEQKCRRGDIDEPISIRLVKRFMADHELAHPWTPPLLEPPKPHKVAVVGAGPAGLTAALRLAQKGYKVTVLEKLPLPGGMMAVGIPEYRLPKAPLFEEIRNIERAGVEILCNRSLGQDFTVHDLLQRDGYHAVILAIGAHKSRKLGIPGEEKQGVLHGTDFLRDAGLAQRLAAHPERGDGPAAEVAGKRVAVIGGGNVALDAARTAWRLGAREVHVIYRRQRDAMPAYAEEVDAALEEGIRFHFLVNPIRVLGDGHVTGLVLQRQRLGEFDSSGRRRPVPIDAADGELVLDVDVVIPAIGQTTDTAWMQDTCIRATKASTFVVDEAFATTEPGVFAAGDAVSGPATVVEAVAQGNLVAVAVDRWLQAGAPSSRWGEGARPHYETPRHDIAQLYDLDDYADARRPHAAHLALKSRAGTFAEVELGYDEHTVREEAKRCLRCDLEWLDYMKIPRPQALIQPERRK